MTVRGGGDQATPYPYGGVGQRELERLTGLERANDAATIRYLQDRGVAAGWTCLEIGGGAGSIARWLYEAVGPSGRVVATDIDTRFLDLIDAPNLVVRRHDIRVEPLEDAAFDLIHTRLVLTHLLEREAVLDKLVAALKPGGWLVIEELCGLGGGADPALDERSEKIVSTFQQEFFRFRATQGFDREWGRGLYRYLTARGLSDVGAEGRVQVVPGGDADPTFRLTVERQRGRLVQETTLTNEDIDAYVEVLSDPRYNWAFGGLMTAWGRHPG